MVTPIEDYFLNESNLRRRSKPRGKPEPKTRINQAIRASQLRVVADTGENLGLLTLEEALQAANDRQLDLIEISPKAKPPVAKIMDYGKYRYESGRKAREVKAKSHVTETKNIQVKIGTGDHDQQLKAKRIAEWLHEGHRVKVDLFLWGRYKYMDPAFLKERLERFLKIVPAEYKVADEIKKGPKGFTTTLENAGGKAPKAVKAVVDEDRETKPKEKQAAAKQKRSLDDLLEDSMI